MMPKTELDALLDKILTEKVAKGPYKGLTKGHALIKRYIDIGTAEDQSGSREGAFLESVLQRILGLGVAGREKAKALKDAAPRGVAIIANLPELPDPRTEQKTLDSGTFPPIADAEVISENEGRD